MTPEQEIRLAALEVACDWAGDHALEGRGHPGPGAVINTAERFEHFIASGQTVLPSRCRCEEDPESAVGDVYDVLSHDGMDALRTRLAGPTPLTDALHRGLA
ncbi:hypothetical protein [Tsukamurella paurometabola]|uniref:Uncharacterized protein n=1 Tax=Tsukamurella paurometabola TaxID=2061 RepID=A0A3P8KM84_TSUPA|nr:hypothetical protein [Tsukamurella paurometabola]UEA84442.1 hypothetical protein LK411_06360 [Tsukamurella paurometabola]VDR37007.1 Uncharacterised protein [Tsukamurella paurometabola]